MKKENERERNSKMFDSMLCDVSLGKEAALGISGYNPLKQKNQR